jgi:linoleoyl-CoA desaturase
MTAAQGDVTPSGGCDRKVVATYLPKTEFCRQVQERVDGYFASTGRSRRDVPRMYLKTAVMLAWLGAAYYALVFVAADATSVVTYAVLLGLAMAGVGFNIQHDGNHGAYSERAWINKAMALSLDLLGGTAYFWHYKHNLAHHTHPNIAGQDDDINVGILGRMSPQQGWYPAHRFQRFYMWAIYGLLAIEWQLTGEFRNLLNKRMIGSTKVPVPAGAELVIFWLGKVVFFGLAFGLPLLRHSFLHVMVGYLVAAGTLGLVLALVFQLAHCSGEATFRAVSAERPLVPRPWAEHQVESTVDFARQSRVLDWYLGGLNFQIVHHLFPKICHVHYRALAPIVEQVCRDHGVRYFAHPTAWAALRSHARWLALMGQRPAAEMAAGDSGEVDVVPAPSL